MIRRFSSRKTDLGHDFLTKRLQGAASYDRIAGYFCSSVLEIAGEAMEGIAGQARIICNSGLNAQDVRTAGLAAQNMKQEWCAFEPEKVYASDAERARLDRLYHLLTSGKLEIRVLPDEIYGLMHGKAGVIRYPDGSAAAFIGSMNETKSALTTNYEIVWEDDSREAVAWVQDEFNFFWHHKSAVPLSEFVVSDLHRIANRRPISLPGWRERNGGEAETIGAAASEEPVYRKEFGLWPHQKYFVARAFREHRQESGARLLLADMVGLGKTVQLAMSAKLMALWSEKPVLILAPKTLLFQWQEEIWNLLDLPSAVWNRHSWVDENGTVWPGDILRCPRRVGIVSQGIITARTEDADRLLDRTYCCVICDEAHRARRRNLSQDADTKKAQPNNLLRFLRQISVRTKSMLLATATPVQTHSIEAFDLLDILAQPPKADNIMGDAYSVWRHTPQTGLDYTTGLVEPPDEEGAKWEILRNPLPSTSERVIQDVRRMLDLEDNQFVVGQRALSSFSPRMKRRLWGLYADGPFVRTRNPYVRCIVRRTRDFLENTENPETHEPYLKRIEVDLHGESAAEALELTGYMAQAYATAQEFCEMLSGRVKGGGFLSTLLLRRIGSTIAAGTNTAEKMLKWAENPEEERDELASLSLEDEDQREDNGETDSTDTGAVKHTDSEIQDLTPEEADCLRRLVQILRTNKSTDPKYYRVKEILMTGTGNDGGWAEKGCIIFSQYYDSARYMAEMLSSDKDFSTPIGLYCGGDKSGLYENGVFEKKSKEELKGMVRDWKLRVLVGTDAASEGLNLQMLSTLINVDLPWNPTRLEQRKGRIHRIGQIAKQIKIYNMRYRGSVEDKVHERLSDRLETIHNLFGQIPEVLEDVWIAVAQNRIEQAEQRIRDVPDKNPFEIQYEMEIPPMGDWEKCEVVLTREEKLEALKCGW